MGNLVQCCHALSNYFKCQDTPAHGGAERSPLLSSEESEDESPSVPDDLEEDLLTPGVTNPALEPEHFLFPDIILSSNLGGEVTLVEPMVCLLVSEEEEAVRADEPIGEEQERSSNWRNRSYSEVETQTEAETHRGTGVQTQTESRMEIHAQTGTHMYHGDALASDVNMLTSTNTEDPHCERSEILLEDVLLEAESDSQTLDKKPSEEATKICTEKINKAAEQRELEEIQIHEELSIPFTGQAIQTEEDTELMKELNTDQVAPFHLQQNVVTAKEINDLALVEQHVLCAQENIKGKTHFQSECSSVMMRGCNESKPENVTIEESQNDTKNVTNFDPDGWCFDLKQSVKHDTEQIHKSHTADQFYLDTDRHTQGQENMETPETGKDDRSPKDVSELQRALQAVEEKTAEVKQKTLLSMDRLFLAVTHANAPPRQVEESPEDCSPEMSDNDERKQLSIRDIVDLQETGFTVRIQPPGTESFELQVSGQMLVVELHQVLMDHELTCHCTCFSLQLRGNVLDSLTQLHSIQGIQEGAPIKVVEDSYSVRDARLHLRHVRDLLRSLDPADAYNGVNHSSLSYLTFYTRGDRDSEVMGSRRTSEKESVAIKPPEYILPNCKEQPLTPLQPVRDDWKPLQCLRVLTMSSWNPPPGNRKMHGDLMYLNVLTMENKELNITSSTRGFYLNQSTAFNFNPKPATPKILCHSLVELLSHVSSVFKRNFSILQKKRVQQHPYERIAAPFQVFTWIACQGDHSLDCVRAEETHTSRMGQDEHTAGQSRDWNEELQGCRELSCRSIEERLHRERCMFKTNCDFVAAATQGAVAVIDGNIVPLNPSEPPHMQMFIWNNLFFSLGFDISDHYQPLGGNTAAHAAAICDLRGTQTYTSVDIKGLHTLGIAVVDYRGIRVIAQTIVPGILEKNQEQSVVYGSNDYGKTVYSHSRFCDLLNKTCKPLRIQRHQVLDHNNSPVELCSGIETKGILGNDGRAYILDLLRTFPPDLNFQFSEMKNKFEVPEVCRSFCYPRRHHHSLASLRPELIEAFVQHRYELFVKIVSEGLKKQDTATEQDEESLSNQCAEDTEFHRRNVIADACKAVGSVSESCFDIRFNPDVCSPGVNFPSECAEEVQQQRKLLWDAAAFLLSDQIPAVLRDFVDQTAVPMDGASLTSALHQRGVNVRYLGTLLQELDRVEHRARLSYIQSITVSEILIRSTKHIFRTYLQDVEPAAFSAAVSHFLNCLLSSSSCLSDFCSDELHSRRRSRRRRNHGSRATSMADSVWAKLSPSELWVKIKKEAEEYYHFTMDSESIDEVIEKKSLQRISLLREMAIKTGIQVQLREYVFESRQRPVFSEEDVVNMFPVVKHLRHTATDGTRLVQHAQVAVQKGLLKDGYELIGQALTLFSSVCGVLHEDVCVCLRLLGRISYVMGDYADALSHQEKAVMSSERVQGIDHPQTIQDYTHLALYCFAGGRVQTSLQLLYRARYLTLLIIGEDHPHVAQLDTMVGVVLHGLMEYELSLKFLQNALVLTSKYHGATSLKYAQSHHVLATLYESKGEFRSALQHEKEAYAIHKSQVGVDHDITKESSEYLKSLTQQAVILQKAINNIYNNTPSACIPTPKFPTPSLPTILRQLNLACGIILFPLSAKEISDLKAELKEKVDVEYLEGICRQ